MALYMITIVIVKARGIIHIAFRVHALSNVIKMLATSVWMFITRVQCVPLDSDEVSDEGARYEGEGEGYFALIGV